MRRSALITSVLLILAGSALVVAVLPSRWGSARRASKPTATVGIGDEQPTMFGNPAFLALHTHIARYVTPYDVVTNHSHNDLPRLQAWLAAAARDHIQPLIAFYHSDRTPKKMPSVKTYTADIKRFLKAFPQVKLLQPWNEANRGYVSSRRRLLPEPQRRPVGRSTTSTLRSLCRSCTIVGLDVLDSTDPSATVRYIKEFKRALGHHSMPTIWGLHNYSDTNRFRSAGTRAVLARHDRPGVADRDRRDREALPELPVQPLAPDAGDPLHVLARRDLARGSRACTSSSGPAASPRRSASTPASPTTGQAAARRTAWSTSTCATASTARSRRCRTDPTRGPAAVVSRPRRPPRGAGDVLPDPYSCGGVQSRNRGASGCRCASSIRTTRSA